jgi:drug/metabolite transporter (DMT)-like permease
MNPSAAAAPSLTRHDNPPMGAALAVLAVFSAASADALIKHASASISLWQMFVLRSVLVIAVLAVVLMRRRTPLAGVLDRWVLARGSLFCAMYLAMYVALPAMPLAAFAAAIYTVPLFVTLLSALVLKTRVSPGEWAAVAVGFVGVLLVLRPGSGLFTPLALLPMLAALFYALAALVTSRKCPAVDPAVMALSLGLLLLALGTIGSLAVMVMPPPAELAQRWPFLLTGWSGTSARSLATVAVLAGLMLTTSLCVIRAYQIAPPPLVSVFEYSYLAFSVAWGVVLFGERPDALALLGLLVLAVAGALAMRGIERNAG